MAEKKPRLFVDELVVPNYTLATAPGDVGQPVGTLAVVTDSTPPALVWWDGTNWIATDDGTPVA